MDVLVLKRIKHSLIYHQPNPRQTSWLEMLRSSDPCAFLHTRPAILALVKGPFQGLHARTLCHATEDLEKVKMAVTNAIGTEEIAVSRTVGVHGNPITVLEALIEDEGAIYRFFEKLSTNDLDEIVRTIDSRMDDKCAVFIRVDKQAAFVGDIRLGRNDDVIMVRLRVRAFPAKRPIASAIVTGFIEDLRKTRPGS